jgi:MYXO-CTERM domain-containing protein
VKRSALLAAIAVVTMATRARAGEPDAAGPYEVDVDDYDLGDEVFAPTGFPQVELTGRVFSPTAKGEGPFPIVLLLHGWHGTCYDPTDPDGSPGDGSYNGGFRIWPCPPQMVPIPSFEGYDQLGELLASHGFLVVSVSANGINANDNDDPDFGMNARADLLDAHLDLWADWNDTGGEPFGDKYVGAVDFERIGALGHSRGGDGVATWAARDQADGGLHRVDAVFLLAPANFWRRVVSNVAMGVLLPYCDGDVYSLEGAHHFDDARYAVPGDMTPKYTFVLDGSNHNYYNTIWSPDMFVAGAADDAVYFEEDFGVDPHCGSTGTGRLSEAAQRDTLDAYAAAFFRTHLRDEVEHAPILKGDVIPASAIAAAPRIAYVAPDDPTQRLDVNHIDADASLQTNELGEDVEVVDAQRYEICGLGDHPQDDPCVDVVGVYDGYIYEGRQPHTPGLGELRIGLEEGGTWTNRLPEGTDVSELGFLQFRVSPDFEPATVGDVSVTLTDAANGSASVLVSEYSNALAPYPGTVYPLYPKKVLSAVRIPLPAFVGVDLENVASITLTAVDAPVAMLLSDLAFTDVRARDPSGTESTGGESTSTTDGADTSSGSHGDPGESETTPSETTDGVASEGTQAGTSSDTSAAGQSGDGGCGCASSGRPGVALLMLGVPLLYRRRRARARRPR